MSTQSEGVRAARRTLQVFLCHSSSDKPTVQELYRKLKSDGIEPWLDVENLLPGEDWEREIQGAVRSSDVVLVCLSKAIYKAGYLQREIRQVLDVADRQPEGVIFLIPVRLEECDVPERLGKWQWVDLFAENGYEKLLKALRKRAGISDPEPSRVPSGVIEASGTVTVNLELFDGTRSPLSAAVDSPVRVLDGAQRQLVNSVVRGSRVVLAGLPHFGDFRDDLTLIVGSNGLQNVGIAPLRIPAGTAANIRLMLLPEAPAFRFKRWEDLRTANSWLLPLLSHGAQDAARRYEDLVEENSAALAGLLNATTIIKNMRTPGADLLDYLKDLVWGTLQPDRFLVWADTGLVDRVSLAVDYGILQPQAVAAIWHPDAPGTIGRGTSSFRELQKGETSLMLTLHENDRNTVDGVQCTLLEVWVDYLGSAGTRVLSKVPPRPGSAGYGISDPAAVYALRWMAARNFGASEFDPPYSIE